MVHTVGISLGGGLGIGGLLSALLVVGSAQTSAADCQPIGDNLLEDPAFTTFGGRHSQRKWNASEHTTRKSFAYTVDQGTLTIEQVATEPWAIVTQPVAAHSLAGKTVKYSAEIKLDLVPNARSANLKSGGGLLLWAKKGSRLVLDSSMEHDPSMGHSDWAAVNVVKQIPKGVTFVEVGFMHQAAGKIAVRNPVLVQVKPACAVAPQASE